MKKHNGMRPQDIVILLAIIADAKNENVQNTSFLPNNNKILAKKLKISESEISESLYRSEFSGLVADVGKKKINTKALLDFLLHGIKYVFPARPEAIGRGVPTAQSANPLKNILLSEEIFVWKFAEGNARGQFIEPLYKTVPEIIENNSNLYELLALVDAIRTGNARTITIASIELEKRILNAV